MRTKPSIDVRKALIEEARKIVTREAEADSLIGACIVSSLAAGDFTPASDVDMLLVAADCEGKPGVFRRLVGDRVFEWMVLPNDYLADVDAVLADAGLCHDILTAIILLDANGQLEHVQQQVALHYQEPQWIRKRIEGQLQRTDAAIVQIDERLADEDLLGAQRAHASALKGFFGIPRAVANKRCTMARGPLFCREAAAELGWSSYVPDVLTILGAAGISAETVVALQRIAAQIVEASALTEAEKAVRQRHLQSSNWLLGNAQPADAVWPLYFWSSTTVQDSGGCDNQVLWDHWLRFTAILGISDKQSLLEKAAQARRLLDATVGRCDQQPRLADGTDIAD